MDLTKWVEKIYPMCPELKPEFLVDADEHGRWKIDGGGPASVPCFVGNTVAAALIRDKAVWWLARQITDTPQYDCLRLWDFNEHDIEHGRFAVDFGDKPDHNFDANDRTEALYLAVCKVLNIDP